VQFIQTLSTFAPIDVLYVPALHFTQTLAPDIALHVPSVQFVQAAEPVADFEVPAPQGVHAVPSAPVYPARQVQKALFAFEKVLFGHVVQLVAIAALYVPARQCIQTLSTFAPTSALHVPSVQFVQTAEPGVDFHVPTPQDVHDPPSAPEYPARHVQDVSRGLPTSEKVLFGHVVQTLANVAPTDALYVPVGQFVQTLAPDIALHVPAMQSVHSTEPVADLY
jgi:hypothetical protein